MRGVNEGRVRSDENERGKRMIRSEREASNKKGVVSLEGQGIEKRGYSSGIKKIFHEEESMETEKWSCGPPFFMYITRNAKLSQALLPVRFEPSIFPL